MAALLKTNDTSTDITPHNGRSFDLQELQQLVGGYIEVVPVNVNDEPSYLVLDEDGKREPKPVNTFATMLFHLAGGAPHDYIAGDAVLCTRTEMGEDDEPPEAE